MKLIKKYQFRNVNVAQFYPRSGTPAVNYDNQIDPNVKKLRSKELQT